MGCIHGSHNKAMVYSTVCLTLLKYLYICIANSVQLCISSEQIGLKRSTYSYTYTVHVKELMFKLPSRSGYIRIHGHAPWSLLDRMPNEANTSLHDDMHVYFGAT